MKKLILFLSLICFGLLTVTAQKTELINCSNASDLLLKEINLYRGQYLLPELEHSTDLSARSKDWNEYQYSQYVDHNNYYYKHSKYGPKEYHDNNGEIIHMVYFMHEPSDYEMVKALMYGELLNKLRGKINGWVDSPEHRKIIVSKVAKTYGCNVIKFHDGKWWTVIGTVKFKA